MKKIINILTEFIQARWLRGWSTRNQLENYQNRRIREHIKYIKRKSPYFMENELTSEFSMDKKFMMENFDALNTVGVKREDAFQLAIEGERTRNFDKKYKGVSVGLSSETSGHRGIFIEQGT